MHINRFHVTELDKYMEMIALHDKSQPFPEDVAELWTTLARIYKNSNCGIKGRGTDTNEMKEIDKFHREKYKRDQEQLLRQQQMRQGTPISPDASSMIPNHRTFYDQLNQQHYAIGSQLSRHQQESPYVQHQHQHQHQQDFPMNPSQQTYHGLPTPAAFDMGWTPQPQYH